jgi:hypothetical protein
MSGENCYEKKSIHICENSIFENGTIIYGKLSSKDCFQAEEAKIKTLLALEIDAKNITTENAKIENLDVNGNATLTTLITNNAEIKNNLNVDGNISTENLHSQTGTIETLNTETLTSETITTNNIIVNQDALIKGDLTVEGGIINVCDELNKYRPPPTSEDVYNQTKIFSSQMTPTNIFPELERIIDLKMNISKRIAGVFGYNSDGSFNLTGGNLYNDQVTEVNFKVNSISSEQEGTYKADYFVEFLPILIKWNTERGFQIPPRDTFPSNQNQFNFVFSNVNVPNQTSYTINMEFIYTTNLFIPSFVDLLALAEIAPVAPDFSADPNRNPIFAYPFRIPITQDCEDYRIKNLNNIPVIFYEEITQQLVISFKNQNYLSYDRTLKLPNGTPNRTIYRMNDFTGRFQLTKRSRSNELIPSSFNNAQLLTQVSDSVFLRSTRILNETTTVFANTFNYRTNAIYTGIVMPLINGGNQSYDIYNMDGSGRIFAFFDVPRITLPLSIGSTTYSIGDNSNTVIVEKVSTPSSIWCQSSTNDEVVSLGIDFLENPLLPEQVAFFPAAENPTDLQRAAYVLSHENTHSTQFGVGLTIILTDAEGQASGRGDMNPTLILGGLSPITMNLQVQFLSNMYVGRWPLLATDSEIRNKGLGIGATYGDSIWWRYIAKVYDPNYQILRRTLDILELTYAPIFSEYEITNIVTYGGGNRLSCQQAFLDIYNLDMSKIYVDFVISASVLRNNDCLDCKYKTYYPYWLQQELYPDSNKTISGQINRYWWQNYDLNTIGDPVTGSTIALQWGARPGIPIQFRFEDLSCFVFVMNRTTISTMTVTLIENTSGAAVQYGKIFAAMIQYIPNSIRGTFKILGPFELLPPNGSHTFDLSFFNRNDGIIRIVMINASITNFGGSGGINNIVSISSINRNTGSVIVTTT